MRSFKKTASVLALLAMFCISFCCCSDGTSESSEAVGKSEKWEQSSGEYAISYSLGELESDFTETPRSATAGQTVIIKTVLICDGDFHVYADGAEIAKTESGGAEKQWEYSFVMPEKNVVITARPYTKAEIWRVETIID